MQLHLLENNSRNWRSLYTRRYELTLQEHNGGLFFVPGKEHVEPLQQELCLRREFLELDITSADALLDFQKKHGLLVSCLRQHGKLPGVPGVPDIAALGFQYHGFADKERDGIRKSAKYAERQAGRKIEWAVKAIDGDLRALGDVSIGAVSFSEASAVAGHLQQIASTLIGWKKAGYEGSGKEAAEVEFRLRFALYVVENHLPTWQVVRWNMDDEQEGSDIPVTLTVALYAQLLKVFMSEEGFRECCFCGEIFQYKQKPTDSLEAIRDPRSPRSEYCSETCRKRFHKRNENQKKKKPSTPK